MEPDATPSASWLKLWAWFEANKKPVQWGAIAVVGLGLIVYFFVWHHAQQAVKAGEDLADAFLGQPVTGGPAAPGQAQNYLRVAATYPGYKAGAQAALLGAAAMFSDGKYVEARIEFEKFLRDQGRGPLRGVALLGVAASLDALHKTNEAITAYERVIDQHPNEPVAPQAKFALASLYEGQNNPARARNLLEDVARTRSYLSQDAFLRLQEMYHKYPSLAPTPPPPQPQTLPLTNASIPAPTTNVAVAPAAGTDRPAPAAPTARPAPAPTTNVAAAPAAGTNRPAPATPTARSAPTPTTNVTAAPAAGTNRPAPVAPTNRPAPPTK
jgi:tetratricopeptide (TPR) repeat protein